jgi:beta-fructofuranosidase
VSRPATRPVLHFTSRSGWINDPLGLTHDDGTYHLFFQHVPAGTVWDPGCAWGHATSTDLLHWAEQPVALSPGDGDQGCWSGSVALPEPGRPVVFYTSVGPPDLGLGTVRTARPAAGLGWTGWSKGDVVVRLPADVPAEVFRDPYVFRDGDRWRMLVGAGLVDGTAAVLGYASDDLERWSYEGVVASRPTASTDPVWTGSAWECPQLFPLGDRWVLLVSVWDGVPQHVAYAVGTWADGRFTADSWRRLTWGDACYAPTVFTDRDGQRGLVHWLRGVDDLAAGWAGALSVPHRLALEGDDLRVQPHPAVDALRRAVADPAGLPDGPTDLGWRVSPDAPLRLHRGDGRVVVELELVGDVLRVRVPGDEAERALPCTDAVVRVLADGPVLEVFTGAAVLAARLPAGPGALRPLDEHGGAVTCWSLAAPARAA